MHLDDVGQFLLISFSSSFNSSCVKTGEKHIVRLDEVNCFIVRLRKRAKR